MGNSWRELVASMLSVSERKKMRASFDTVGDIAIVEIARGLSKKERKLAKLLLDSQPSIKVVAKKMGGHVGKFRHQPLKVIAGEKRLETIHKESGCQFKLNVQTCYFSPRLGTERMRVAKLVRPNEDVLVLFAGVAPFSIVLARLAKPAHIDSVELNPDAHKFALENVKLNKVDSIVAPIKADAAKFLKSCKKRYARILLAWPGHADKFIPAAIKAVKKGGTLHFYDFAEEGEFGLSADKVTAACKTAKRNCKVSGIHVCGQKKPRVHRVCVDVLLD
jgi:tRNA (guanine37-N1)-methyltransferase